MASVKKEKSGLKRQDSPSLKELLLEDLQVCGGDWTKPGFRALAVYRFGVWRRARFRGRVSRRLVKPVMNWFYLRLYRYVRNHYGIELHEWATIGRRCWVVHQHGIAIHPRTIIGDDCIIEHMVTIGAAKEGLIRIVLGNGVKVGVGAVIVGNVEIGENARIGPNAVVTMNVPAGATVFGNPARILPPAAPRDSDAHSVNGKLDRSSPAGA